MKLQSEECRMQNKKRKNAGIFFTAGILTLFLHGLVFSVPAYLIYMGAKSTIDNRKPEIKNSTIFIDVAMLPDIQAKGEESRIQEAKGKKPEQGRQEPGLGNQAEKQGEEKTEKEMLTYQDMIKQKIQQARQYPSDARQKGIEGGVEMAFTIMKQGALKNVEITGASGFEVLDEEAVSTIKRASPFPEMPADYKEQEMTMRVKIVFNIE